MATVDNFAQELEEIAQEWFAGINAELQENAINETANATVKKLKETSPKDRGDYARSWAYEKNTSGGALKLLYSTTVYNKKHYRLTHLLENGHAKVNGGRTKAQPHIAPAESYAEEMLIQKTKEVFK